MQKGFYMNPTNNQLRAVLWDMDGTLIDSMPYHVEAWHELLEPLGYHFTTEDLLKTFGLRNEEIVRDHLKLDLPYAELQRLIEEKEEHYRALVRERGLALLPGAQHWLEYIKAHHWPQAIVSSAPRLNMDAVLQSSDLGAYMDTIVCAEDVERGKPYPDPFLLAAERLSIQPDRCIVVEDAPAGLEGARRAGMKTIGVLNTHEELEADIVVKSLVDLMPDAFERTTSNM
jgi:beta-phosphoglucomutase family hydrolase